MQIITLIHHGQDIHGLLRFRTGMDFRGAWMEHTLSKSDFHIVHAVSIFSLSVNKWCIIRPDNPLHCCTEINLEEIHIIMLK